MDIYDTVQFFQCSRYRCEKCQCSLEWVKMSKARDKHMFAGLLPIADLRFGARGQSAAFNIEIDHRAQFNAASIAAFATAILSRFARSSAICHQSIKQRLPCGHCRNSCRAGKPGTYCAPDRGGEGEWRLCAYRAYELSHKPDENEHQPYEAQPQ